MLSNLKPYPAYKDSGLLWLGTIPSHWEIRRNGRLFDQRNQTGFSELPILEVSLKTGVRIREMDSGRKQIMSDRDAYKRTAKGDIAYNMMRMWQGAVGVAPADGLVSPAYVVAQPLAGVDPRYYCYLFRTAAYMDEVDKFSRGIVKDRNRLYWDQFKQMPSAFPPMAEQRRIADYLDHNASLVRKLIRNKLRLSDVLTEQKRAIVTHAITRGIDRTVKLKPSGIDWLGDVPEHWDTISNRQLFRETTRKYVGGEETQLSLSQRDGLIATERMQERSLQTASYDNWKICLPGDIVLNRFKAHLGVFFAATLRGIVTFHYGVFAPRRDLNPKYFELLFHTDPYRTIYAGLSNGMTVGLQNLSNQNFYKVRSLVPPKLEQDQVVAAVARETEHMDTAITKAQREIDLIREFRSRLMADVVTGKIDVRYLAPAECEAEPVAFEPLDTDSDSTAEDDAFEEVPVADD